MKLSMQNKTSHHLEDNDEFYFDNDILNDKVHLFFKSDRNSVDEYSMSGHKFLNSFEVKIGPLSNFSSIFIILTPIFLSPFIIALWIGAAPLHLGNNDA